MNLNFSFSQTSDNKTLVITDTTPDWIGGQIANIYAHRNDGTTKATLTLTIFGIAYDVIDVISEFASGLQANLIYEIEAQMLEIDGEPAFNEGENIPDGDVVIKYDVIDTHNLQTDTFSDSYLIYGTVEEKVLLEIQETNTQALTCESSLNKANVRLLHFSYMMSMINSAQTGQITNLRTDLTNLNYMIDNKTF